MSSMLQGSCKLSMSPVQTPFFNKGFLWKLAFVYLLGSGLQEPLGIAQAACLFKGEKGYRLREAHSSHALQKGLMGVTDLGQEYGMIFVFPRPQRVTFWMKNTFLPLDIVFIDAERIIQHIHKGARPLSHQRIFSKYPVAWVIELKAGLADQFNLKVGSYVSITFGSKNC